MDKQLSPSDEIVQSLINLRDELFARQDPTHLEVFYKINSCLYRCYPTKNTVDSSQVTS